MKLVRNEYMFQFLTLAVFSVILMLSSFSFLFVFFLASILRHVYLRRSLGVGHFTRVYGGKEISIFMLLFIIISLLCVLS